MKGYLKYILFFIVILLSIFWLGGFFSKKILTQEIKQEEKLVQGLEIGKVEKLEQVESTYVATMVAGKRAEISSKLIGSVVSIEVKEGDCVKRGKLLVRIDAKDVQSQVQALEKQKEQAEFAYRSAMAHYEAIKKTYDRYSKLLKEGAVTQQEFDQVKAQFESAEAQVKQAMAGVKAIEYQKSAVASNLSYANIVAPFDGCVVSKMVDVGDLATPGQPLIIFEGGPYKVEAHLPEMFLEKIEIGNKLKVAVGEKILEGRVVEKSNSIDPTSRTFRIELAIPSDGLRSGMLAKVFIPQAKSTLLIPKSAVVKRFDFTGVWVVREDNTLELRFVKLGEEIGDKVEILSGLKEGERIIVGGVERACEGCKIGG
ncbi:efflux RND transporter periplasmic adaptor subunit [Thermocrinis sp.]